MRRSPLFALAALTTVCTLSLTVLASAKQITAKTSRDDETIRQVLEMERHTREATLRNDAAFTERILADDYIAIGPLGTVVTKAETVAAHREAQLHYDSLDVTEMAVRVYGDMAVVTARAHVKGNNLGEDFSGPYRFTRVWVKHNGEWHTVAYQATATR
jgi:ketosteroid isomerase-like protein